MSSSNSHHQPDVDLSGLMGLGSPMGDLTLREQASPSRAPAPTPGEIAYCLAENRELRAEADRIRVERDTLLDLRAQIMELLGTRKPERLLHDLRNLLNERELFKALADTIEG